MKRLSIYLCLGLLFSTTQCISPFDIKLRGSGDILVVEGAITDEEAPYTIFLSKSTSLDQLEKQSISGATVVIEEQSGETERLEEVRTGIYQSSGQGIKGKLNQQYRLRILWEDNTYLSSWETLKAAAPIDSIYGRASFISTESGQDAGLQFYLDVEDDQQLAKYYRWEWEESWKYRSPLPANFAYLGNNNIELIPAKEFCYQTIKASDILLANTQLNQGILKEFPISYVSSQSEKLGIRYSLLVRQIPMDEKEYLFWKGLSESNNSVGSLYDRQPASIQGNIENIENEDETVLGYFSAYSSAEKRVFISRNDLPDTLRISTAFVQACRNSIDTIPIGPGADAAVFAAIEEGLVFYDFDRFIQITGYLMAKPECADCTLRGGSLEAPEFWIE